MFLGTIASGKIMKGAVAAIRDFLQCFCYRLLPSQSQTVIADLLQTSKDPNSRERAGKAKGKAQQ